MKRREVFKFMTAGAALLMAPAVSVASFERSSLDRQIRHVRRVLEEEILAGHHNTRAISEGNAHLNDLKVRLRSRLPESVEVTVTELDDTFNWFIATTLWDGPRGQTRVSARASRWNWSVSYDGWLMRDGDGLLSERWQTFEFEDHRVVWHNWTPSSRRWHRPLFIAS